MSQSQSQLIGAWKDATSGKAVAAIAHRSKVPSDFTNRLSNEGMEDVHLVFRPPKADSQIDCMVDIVSKKEWEEKEGKKVFPMHVWTPFMTVHRAVLHGVGLLESKFNEDNIAKRKYFLRLKTTVSDALLAEINGLKQARDPGFDLKADHAFYNDGNKRMIGEKGVFGMIMQRLWENADFAKTWREAKYKEAVDKKREAMRRDLDQQKKDGAITQKQYLEEIKSLNKNKTLIQADDPEYLAALREEFLSECTVPMLMDEDSPEDLIYDIKIPIFRNPSDTPLGKVTAEAVQEEFNRILDIDKAECVAAGKAHVLDDRKKRRITIIATKDLCEGAGYVYNPIKYLHVNVDKGFEISDDIFSPTVYSGFIVRVGYRITAQSATNKKFGIKFMGKPEIQIIKAVKPDRIDSMPESSEDFQEWSLAGIKKLVGQKDETSEEDAFAMRMMKRKADDDPFPSGKHQKSENGDNQDADGDADMPDDF